MDIFERIGDTTWRGRNTHRMTGWGCCFFFDGLVLFYRGRFTSWMLTATVSRLVEDFRVRL